MTIDELPLKWRKQVELMPGKVSPIAAKVVADRLRHQARLAFLDGRSAQAKKFNRYADFVSRAAQQ
jgi:propanediol dehydratase small subunit